MRWYQVDSDTPNDPKIKRLMDRAMQAQRGNDGAAANIGRLFLLWCYVANHGHEPGAGVKADGQPLDLSDMAYECRFQDEAELRDYLAELAALKLIDPERWAAGIVLLPAMQKRADDYAKRKGRGTDPGRGTPGGGGGNRGKPGAIAPDVPLQDTTRQDTTGQKNDLLADAGQDNVDALVHVWNTERKPGPTVRDITPQRRAAFGRALKARPDLQDWRLVIRYMNGQKWANAGGGGDHPTWRADLDWLAKPGKLVQWLEKAQADRQFMRVQAGADTGTEGRNAAKGRTGFKRGEFAAALEGGDDGGQVH